MAKQTIGIGAVANDGTGDPLRDAYDKTNDNFTELYGPQGAVGPIIDPLFLSMTTTTVAIDNASYMVPSSGWEAHMDYDLFPATHFKLLARALSNEAAQTITLQLDSGTTGVAPAHTGGNDLVITNTFGVFDSGWRTRDDALTGFQKYNILAKGSNATVDLQLRYLRLLWKRVF